MMRKMDRCFIRQFSFYFFHPAPCTPLFLWWFLCPPPPPPCWRSGRLGCPDEKLLLALCAWPDRCCQEGISGGGAAISLARPPLSGTLPTLTLVIDFELRDSGGWLEILLIKSKSFLAAKMSATAMLENLLKLDVDKDSATGLGILWPNLSDHAKDCKVALNRVISIVRLKAYSASRCWAIWK